MGSLSVGVMVMTYNAAHHLHHCLQPILKSKIVSKVLVVNSSGTDDTVAIAKKMGAEVLVIPRNEFNHGVTKEYARRYLNTDIIVMMSPDAYGVDDFIQRLVEPICKENVALTYSRQIPHKGADFFEAFPREFNYPKFSETRTLETLKKRGPDALFCSNTCAAYFVAALDDVGGFPMVLTGEDTIVASRLLKKGYKIKYVSESVVHHSHTSTLMTEFKRHFDAGYARNIQFKEDMLESGSDTKKGWEYTKEFLKETLKLKPYMIGYSMMIILFKYMGYKLGSIGKFIPLKVKIKLSSQEFYWVSIYFDGK